MKQYVYSLSSLSAAQVNSDQKLNRSRSKTRLFSTLEEPRRKINTIKFEHTQQLDQIGLVLYKTSINSTKGHFPTMWLKQESATRTDKWKGNFTLMMRIWFDTVIQLEKEFDNLLT